MTEYREVRRDVLGGRRMTEYIVKCREFVGITGKTFQFPEYIDQTEEIVRCRDCKHYREHEFVIVTDVSDVCQFFAGGVKVEPYGFCAWGERKEVDA